MRTRCPFIVIVCANGSCRSYRTVLVGKFKLLVTLPDFPLCLPSLNTQIGLPRIGFFPSIRRPWHTVIGAAISP